MRVLLDTDIVSELRKGRRCAQPVAAWQATVPLALQYLSVVTLFELRLGIELKRRQDERAAAVLDTWYRRQLRPSYAGRTLAVDDAVAECCAPLHVQQPRPYRDSLIAATALVHGLTIATRNSRDFEGLGARLVDPWGFDEAAGRG